ncbi:hypothetical protein ACVC7V_14520 [Hydrogenophaga sp. A37]|uniref:hypothetical protein n=1 Tax=Hydrogenophaga sp. A37 TaxID=1945864 RepID=UPI0009844BD8|nr:hypothetical protein [Hydrogenophaga sp. A37]OOG89418.1 hypothetical protein B0E41_00455 [Hydrogenophaga sp. A37]
MPSTPTDPRIAPLVEFLARVPTLRGHISSGVQEGGLWWVKFGIDIEHPMAWRVVQELGHILNYVSIEEPLPSVFKPVSPPVYLNGGPKEYLSWIIEPTHTSFTPALCKEWLEGRLPKPVDNLSSWELEDDDADEP